MNERNDNDTDWPEHKFSKFGQDWEGNLTATRFEMLQPHYQFLAVEYGWGVPKPGLQLFDWEHPKIVSMIVMRHPIDRLLSTRKCNTFYHTLRNDPNTTNQNLWWEYASSFCSNNYALRILPDNTYSPGKNNDCCSNEDKLRAMTLLSRFTFVIDQDCLTESMDAIAQRLNIVHQVRQATNESAERRKYTSHHSTIPQTAKERIGENETLCPFGEKSLE